VLLAYVLIEIGACIILYFRCGGFLRTSEELRQAVTNAANPHEINTRFQVVHPYLGFVMHMDNDDYHVQGQTPFRVNDYGFYDAGSPIRKRSPDRVLVAVTGGSVAHQFAVLSSDALGAALAERFPGRRIEFVRSATPGYKQPQQLMTLGYVLALGGQLDVLINIDGFNEVALPRAENVEHGVFAAFPRAWHERVVTGNDIPLMRAIGHIEHLRQQRGELAETFRHWWWSPTAVLIWNYRKCALQEKTLIAQRVVSGMKSLEQGFCAHGPSESFESPDDMSARFSEIWADCSLQMDRLCAANGIEYWHFLQPTRHFPEIDPTDDSRGINDNIPGEVQRGYPLLQRQGRRLRAQGVEFHDLTGIFESLPERPYYDFCHFIKPANDVMAEQIGRIISAGRATEASAAESRQ
jgi:hypothetical protein